MSLGFIVVVFFVFLLVFVVIVGFCFAIVS